MRPQGFGQMGVGLEDLGWNDMGHSHAPAQPSYEPVPEHVPSSIAALTPAPRNSGYSQPAEEPVAALQPVSPPQPAIVPQPVVVPEPVSPPPVIEQQRAVEAAFAEKSEPAKVVRAPKARVNGTRQRSAPGEKAKAAFTLRLDPDRHLKLRLACAVKHRSAQQIVTEALDHFLATLPEIEAMASRVPAKPGANKN
jgi:hypothetical protein